MIDLLGVIVVIFGVLFCVLFLLAIVASILDDLDYLDSERRAQERYAEDQARREHAEKLRRRVLEGRYE